MQAALLGNVGAVCQKFGEDFQPSDQVRCRFFRDACDRLQDSVQAKADFEFAVRRLEVEIACLLTDALPQDGIDELRDVVGLRPVEMGESGLQRRDGAWRHEELPRHCPRSPRGPQGAKERIDLLPARDSHSKPERDEPEKDAPRDIDDGAPRHTVANE